MFGTVIGAPTCPVLRYAPDRGLTTVWYRAGVCSSENTDACAILSECNNGGAQKMKFEEFIRGYGRRYPPTLPSYVRPMPCPALTSRMVRTPYAVSGTELRYAAARPPKAIAFGR
eukprot:3941804-Rhodomonas_salina.1